MTKPLPNHKPPASDEKPIRSIGQVIEQHLDEIVGPETAKRLRRHQKAVK